MAGASRQARSRTAALPFPGRASFPDAPIRRLLPSGRALLAGFALLAAAALAYAGARETSLFAVRAVVVTGAPPRVAAHVRSALRPLNGESLLAVDSAEIRDRLARLPDVATVTYNRDFPHTLRIAVAPAHSIAVLRKGPLAWIVSSSGRVVRRAGPLAAPRLPRIWVPKVRDVEVGAPLADDDASRAIRVLAAARAAGFAERIATVRTTDELTFVLASGIEVRFGDATGLAVKLEVVRSILPLAGSVGYLDVSVPERPVSGGQPSSRK